VHSECLISYLLANISFAHNHWVHVFHYYSIFFIFSPMQFKRTSKLEFERTKNKNVSIQTFRVKNILCFFWVLIFFFFGLTQAWVSIIIDLEVSSILFNSIYTIFLYTFWMLASEEVLWKLLSLSLGIIQFLLWTTIRIRLDFLSVFLSFSFLLLKSVYLFSPFASFCLPKSYFYTSRSFVALSLSDWLTCLVLTLTSSETPTFLLSIFLNLNY